MDGELTDYVIYFTRNLDPNGKSQRNWPKYDLQDPKALVFKDDILFRVVVEDDNYRADALNFVANMSLLHPI